MILAGSARSDLDLGDGDGPLVGAGCSSPSARVAKIGADGAHLWSRRIEGSIASQAVSLGPSLLWSSATHEPPRPSEYAAGAPSPTRPRSVAPNLGLHPAHAPLTTSSTPFARRTAPSRSTAPPFLTRCPPAAPLTTRFRSDPTPVREGGDPAEQAHAFRKVKILGAVPDSCSPTVRAR